MLFALTLGTLLRMSALRSTFASPTTALALPSPIGQGPLIPTGEVVEMSSPGESTRRLEYIIELKRLNPPKYSPKKFGNEDPEPFEFDWEVAGYGKRHETDSAKNLVFRVFSQEKKPEGDVAPMVCRMLLRLWDLDYRKLRFDHQAAYDNKVDVYICWGGTPGGEQKMDVDYTRESPPRQVRVNTIYIYDLASFTSPVEMAREVAHEYGHAVLTPVGGFVTPEDWGNGQLGEKLFLRWCRDEMAAGRLEQKDVMGASLKDLSAWVSANVDPLVISNAAHGPYYELLEGQGQAAMDSFTGLVCYADAILPEDVVGTSLKLMSDSSAKSYPPALLLACENQGKVVLGIPDLLKGKDLWVPLGRGKAVGAEVLRRNGDWAQIRPGLAAVTLVYPQP